MDPKVTIIVPIYNVEKYLRQCLDSVINQTLEDIEIICINDGSTDSSGEILKEIAATDKRILSIHKANGGYGAACNIGLNLAKGEFIAILEPDDFVDVRMYKTLYEEVKRENADIVKSPFYKYVDADDNCEEMVEKVEWEYDYELPSASFTIDEYPQFLYFHPSIWTCLYKTEFLRKNNIHFVEAKGAGWVDNPFQVETLFLANKIAWVDDPFYYYRFSNPTASSVLKDFSIPFSRCDEIHSFLNRYNINNENLLAFIYKRELGYVDQVLDGIKIEQLDSIKSDMDRMIKRMNSAVIESHPSMTGEEKKRYKSFAMNYISVCS